MSVSRQQEKQEYDVEMQKYGNQVHTLQEIMRAYNGLKPSGPPPASGLGNPGPLGLAGFAMTTFILSVFNTGVLIDPRLEGVVLPLALFYGGIAQFIAGLFEYKINNTFGATAFCSYGAFWCSFAGYVYLIAPGLPESTGSHATGLFLLAWTIFTAYMTAAAFKVTRGLFALFVALTITFILLTAGTFAGSAGASHAGGWFGILTAFIAWYLSFAVTFNTTWGKAYIPIGILPKPN
jgi:succinate-acetate transporter protein